MRCFIGIDLGSTTTKAVVMDENQNIIGRGITNSRSNYDTAATIAKQEALLNGRFYLFRQALGSTGALNGALDGFINQLERDFRSEQYLEQLADLEETCKRSLATAHFGAATEAVGETLTEVFRAPQGGGARAVRGRRQAQERLLPRHRRQPVPGRSARTVSKDAGTRYDFLLNVFDRSIIEVENRVYADSIRRHLLAALEQHVRRPAGNGGAAHPGRGADQGHPGHRDGRDLRGRHRLRPRAPAVLEGACALGDPVPRARRARDVSRHGHRAGHRRPGHQGDPGRPGRHRRELPDERPLRGGLRALPRLHRRRDEHGPARAGPHGDEVDQDDPHQLHLHRVRRRRAARPPQPGRQARGHHGRPAPLHHPARHVDPGALGRRARPVHLHRRRRQERGRGEVAEGAGEGELRRGAAQHRPGFDLHRRTRRRHVRVARRGARRQDSRSEGQTIHDHHHRYRYRLRTPSRAPCSAWRTTSRSGWPSAASASAGATP